MPRCKPISNEDWCTFKVNLDTWVNEDYYKIPVEHKQNSFGWLNENIVALDYG
jgi:hypothetical protein